MGQTLPASGAAPHSSWAECPPHSQVARARGAGHLQALLQDTRVPSWVPFPMINPPPATCWRPGRALHSGPETARCPVPWLPAPNPSPHPGQSDPLRAGCSQARADAFPTWPLRRRSGGLGGVTEAPPCKAGPVRRPRGRDRPGAPSGLLSNLWPVTHPRLTRRLYT